MFLILMALQAPLVLAQEPFSESGTVIVVSGTTEVFAGNDPIGEIRPGAIVHYSQENGSWLFSPRHAGWINRDQVVPIESALTHFNRIISEEPTAQAFQHRGIVHSHLGNYDAAIADFRCAEEMGLEDAGLYINRGVAHQQAGYLRAAIEDYTKAIQLDANSAPAYDNRSSALAELGELESSLADSNEAIRLDPEYPEAYNNRGVTHRLLGDYEQAVADYTAAIELFKGYAAACANRGYARKQLGQYESAIEDYEKAIRLSPDWGQPHNDLAWLLATCADPSFRDATRAVSLARRASQLTKMANGDFLDTYAAALAASGDFEQAVATGERALELIDDDQKLAVQARVERYRAGKAFYEE